MIATTTRSSRREKPALATRAAGFLEIPVPDVGIDTFAAFLAIRAVGKHVEIAALTRRGVEVRLIPRIDGDPRQLLLPVRRARLAGVRHERFETLGRARIAEIVESVQIQSRLDGTKVGPGAIRGGLVDLAHEVRRDGGH